MSEILQEEVVANESGVSRRRVVAGVAWSLPVIATAIAAPAAAASGISATTALVGTGSAISFVSSTGTGSGTNHTGTGPTGFQVTNAGSAFTGVISGTVNIKPVGTVIAGAGLQALSTATLTPAAVPYTNTFEYNATFVYAGGMTAGQTLNFPMTYQYQRLTGSGPSKTTYTYTLTITLRLPDNTDRVLTGTITVNY
ncbi:hypothetical protein [Arthrobacter sp. SD76]|uniref:hypothetical protein n=1 Tax=Arthrobacter sp. SD76 TaxID=3415007 RepID=UPI003C713A9A